MWGSEGSVPGPQTGRGATRKSLRRTRSGARSVGPLSGALCPRSGSLSLVSPCSGAPDSGDAEMNSVDTNSKSAIASPPVMPGEFRLEVVVVPVSDIDRAKSFYEGLGWQLDAEAAVEDGFRAAESAQP